MESSQEHFEQQQKPPGEMQQLKSNSQATVAELREFLGNLKGRSPQEVMGVVAQSSLVQGITTAAFACVVLIAVFTIGPYFIYGPPNTAEAAQPASQVKTEQPTAPAETSASSTDQATAASAAEPAKTDINRAAEAMGIGETQSADPESNPLDNKLDNLLDGLE